MIKTLLIFSLCTFIQFNSCNKDEDTQNVNANNSTIKETKNTQNNLKVKEDIENTFEEKLQTISQLNKTKPKEGIFETQGFVAKIYTCPACPPDAQCKPCMGDNIVISEENKSLENYSLTEKELIIFTNKVKTFSQNKEYKFKIKITDGKTTSANLNDANLISADLVKD